MLENKTRESQDYDEEKIKLRLRQEQKTDNMDKTEQNLTRSATPKVNPLTGLTPVQEQCASLLAAGEKISAVADMVQVSRTTIYQWNELITFQCFMNQLRDEVQKHMNQSLSAMTEQALTAIRQTLASENESLRLKAAIWLIEKMASVEVGNCNPFKVIREEATYTDLIGMDEPEFHPSLYEKRLTELGLEEPNEG